MTNTQDQFSPFGVRCDSGRSGQSHRPAVETPRKPATVKVHLMHGGITVTPARRAR